MPLLEVNQGTESMEFKKEFCQPCSLKWMELAQELLLKTIMC